MKKYRVIGVMSGTSTDGIDMACCDFWYDQNRYHYSIVATDFVEYSQEWKHTLRTLIHSSAQHFIEVDTALGRLLGESVKNFIEKYVLSHVDCIASHGHTVFHQPQKQLTSQIGNGAVMAAICQKPVICDFRRTDMAYYGQGAPLVPIGDELLFSEYDYCLNIGGIANISYQKERRIAYDICPANLVLNHLAQKKGKEYDQDGYWASQGNWSASLWDRLNALPFYAQKPPKSLGREWCEDVVFPLIEQANLSIEDSLCTFVHHIAYQISLHIAPYAKILVTGGGTHHTFLVEMMQKYASKSTFIIPDAQLIAYKEAVIFAFLGVLRWTHQINALQSVTGATRNSCGGCIYWY